MRPDRRIARIELLQQTALNLRRLLRAARSNRTPEAKVWCEKMDRHYANKLAAVQAELNHWHSAS